MDDKDNLTPPLAREELELDDTNGDATVYKVYKRRWFGLAGLMLMNIVTSWGWLTYAPVTVVTQEWFNLSSPTPVNWLSTAIFFTYALATPAVLYTLARHGFRHAILTASALVLLGNWTRYAATLRKSYAGVMTGQILIGFAQPFVLSSVTHYSDLWFTSTGRVTATALASLSNPFGAALGQLVNPIIATKSSDLPSMTMYVAVIATVAALPWGFVPTRPPSPPCRSAAEVKMDVPKAVKEVFKNRGFVCVFVLFSVYLGFFNAMTSMLNQMMDAYGYTASQAGIMGAILIVCGLVSSAVVSPLVDKTHSFTLAIKAFVPLIAAGYVGLIFAPHSHALAPPYIVAALLGAFSFSLLPLSLEWAVELTHPAPPEVTSAPLWVGGQVLGAGFLLGMDALARGRAWEGDGGMWRALVFEGVVAVGVVPLAWGVGGRGSRRIEADGR